LSFLYLGFRFIYNKTEHFIRRCCGSYWYRVLKVSQCGYDDDDDDDYDKGTIRDFFACIPPIVLLLQVENVTVFIISH